MIERTRRTRPIVAAALLLTLLLAACSTLTEELLPAAIIPPTDAVVLTADAGASTTGSFTFSSDERTRYTVSENADWLTITSGAQGNIKPGQTKTVGLLATCTGSESPDDATVTITSRSGSVAVVTVQLGCGSDPPPPPPPPTGSEFEITLEFSGSITEAQKDVFRSAAARWAELVVGDVADVSFRKRRNACGAGDPAFNGVVDDVVIYASIEPIDGPGNILGSAGPCYIRSGSGLPLYGVMRFDSVDIESLGDSFQDVILHEMGHVIGIGTLWEYLELLAYSGGNCQSSSDPTFIGSGAVSEWQLLDGVGNVPVEDEGGSGTKCGHWDDVIFDNELMTGYLSGSTSNPISAMTVASLGDLGYDIDASQADPYDLPPSPSLQIQGARLDFEEVLLTPIGVVGEDGSIMSAD